MGKAERRPVKLADYRSAIQQITNLRYQQCAVRLPEIYDAML